MKLQNLSVIFIIIIVPIILVVSYYINLQIDTINLQTSYDTKLQESAREAMSAFEINTVEWNSSYSMLADSKRRDIRASANTFLNSLANKMGIGGTSKEYMLNYVPALAYTLYDGYYIYANTKTSDVETANGTGTVVLGADGQPSKDLDHSGTIESSELNNETYDHMLQSFTPYSETLINDSEDVVTINYTLDNYVRVYYKPSSVNEPYEVKEGYLTDPNAIDIIAPATVKFSNNNILGETLSEQIYYLDETSYKNGTFTYVYDSNNVKTYYDTSKSEFFQLGSDKKRNYLKDMSTAKYKKIVEVDTCYQALCDNAAAGVTKGNVYTYNVTSNEYSLDISKTTAYLGNLDKDYSAKNYFIESYVFTNWFNDIMKDKSWTSNMDGTTITSNTTFEISNTNNPDPESSDYQNSLFTQHKREVMKNSIEKNLERVVSDASKELANATYEFRLPVLSETDWDQLLSNVSLIAFLQGVPTGLKTYNNYVISTSNNNKEYVAYDRIFLSVDRDEYYHKKGCTHIKKTATTATGYRSIDYILKTQKISDTETNYFYSHDNTSNIYSQLECYSCIVDPTKIGGGTTSADKFDKEYYTALARERYIQQ